MSFKKIVLSFVVAVALFTIVITTASATQGARHKYTCTDPDGWCEAYNRDGTPLLYWGVRMGMPKGATIWLYPLGRGWLYFTSFLQTAYYHGADFTRANR